MLRAPFAFVSSLLVLFACAWLLLPAAFNTNLPALATVPIPAGKPNPNAGYYTAAMALRPAEETFVQAEITPKWVKQSHSTRLTLSQGSIPVDPLRYELKVGNETFPIYGEKNGQAMALIPIDPLQKVGSLTATVTDKTTGEVIYTTDLHVTSGNFKQQAIRVSKQTAELQPEAGELEAIIQFKQSENPVRSWWQPFVAPVPDCMNSPFGVRRIVNGQFTGNYHKGVDQRSPMGRPVKAIAGGTIKIARNYRLHGGTVGVDHGQGLSSIYIHLSQVLVRPGDVVTKGQVIGKVGSTGFAAGPHLHWGFYIHGVPVDPTPWVALSPCAT